MTTDAPTHLPDGRPIPLMTGDERLMLESWLDFHRATLELKCAGLEDSQLRLAAAGPSELTLLGLVQHLAECERNWFQRVVGGLDVPPVYGEGTRPGTASRPGGGSARRSRCGGRRSLGGGRCVPGGAWSVPG